MHRLAADRDTAPAAQNALVIGYGSPIRGDDAVGPLVADRLLDEGVPAGAIVLSRHVLTADLVPNICAADLVIFIDAAAEGSPGEIHCRRLAPAPGPPATMVHFLDPGELLAWADALYDRRPLAYLLSTPGHCFDFGNFKLSEPVARTVDVLTSRVRRLLADTAARG